MNYQSEFDFKGYIPSGLYDEGDLLDFSKEYNIPYEIAIDRNMSNYKKYDIQTIPTIVIVENGRVMYKGAIDNYYFDLGKHRVKADTFFLRDAINSVLVNDVPNPQYTKPIGCKVFME